MAQRRWGLRRAFGAGLLIVAWAVAAASGARPLALGLTHRIDTVVRQVLVEEKTPSASIAIVLDGRLVYAAAYGAARLAPRAPATPGTRYQLASISKTFTAEALLLLEQDGRLSLDDPVSRWIPSLSQGDRVTIRQLLQHTAGFPDHYPQSYPAGPRTAPTTPDQIIAEWGRHPLLFAPGSQFRYSNMNYVIAGRIAEKVSGQPLFGFLQQRVFGPLGMSSTLDLDDIRDTAPNLAVGYVRPALATLQPAPAEGRGWSFGAGEIVTTASDLARWDEAFLAGRLLATDQAREEVDPAQLTGGGRSSYALGLFVSHKGGQTTYYHSGQGLGFLTLNRLYPAERAAIVVLTNDSSSPAFLHLADRIAYLVIPPTPADAEARAVFAALQKGRMDRSRFTPEFNTYFDQRRERQFARSLGRLGEPSSFVLHGEDTADGITTRTYDVVAGGHALRVVQQTLANGQLEDFDVQKATN